MDIELFGEASVDIKVLAFNIILIGKCCDQIDTFSEEDKKSLSNIVNLGNQILDSSNFKVCNEDLIKCFIACKRFKYNKLGCNSVIKRILSNITLGTDAWIKMLLFTEHKSISGAITRNLDMEYKLDKAVDDLISSVDISRNKFLNRLTSWVKVEIILQDLIDTLIAFAFYRTADMIDDKVTNTIIESVTKIKTFILAYFNTAGALYTDEISLVEACRLSELIETSAKSYPVLKKYAGKVCADISQVCNEAGVMKKDGKYCLLADAFDDVGIDGYKTYVPLLANVIYDINIKSNNHHAKEINGVYKATTSLMTRLYQHTAGGRVDINKAKSIDAYLAKISENLKDVVDIGFARSALIIYDIARQISYKCTDCNSIRFEIDNLCVAAKSLCDTYTINEVETDKSVSDTDTCLQSILTALDSVIKENDLAYQNSIIGEKDRDDVEFYVGRIRDRINEFKTEHDAVYISTVVKQIRIIFTNKQNAVPSLSSLHQYTCQLCESLGMVKKEDRVEQMAQEMREVLETIEEENI